MHFAKAFLSKMIDGTCMVGTLVQNMKKNNCTASLHTCMAGNVIHHTKIYQHLIFRDWRVTIQLIHVCEHVWLVMR